MFSACAPGTYSAALSSTCSSSCAAGYFQSDTGASSCLLTCAAGTYSSSMTATLQLEGRSQGMDDGDSPYLYVYIDGVTQQKSFGFSRGFTVITFSSTGSVSSTRNFDTYGLSSASDAMLLFLQGLSTNTITVFIVKDEASNSLGTNVKTYMIDYFGATMINSLSFRDSYALIARKGASSKLAEAWTKKATGSAYVHAETSICLGCLSGSCSAATASTSCSSCSIGTYQASTSQSSCASCPAGRYCGMTGLSSISGICTPGSYSFASASAC